MVADTAEADVYIYAHGYVKNGEVDIPVRQPVSTMTRTSFVMSA